MVKNRVFFDRLINYDSYLFILFLISLFAVGLAQNIKANHLRGTSPLILPLDVAEESDLFADKDANYTLKCMSDEPIHWRLSTNQQKNNHRIEQLDLNTPNYYETHLHLINVNHRFVGLYYCAKNSSANANLQTQFQNRLASKIYVFVSDDKNPMSSISNAYIRIRDNCDFFVPCKSSTQKDTVKLTLMRSERQGNRTISERGSEIFVNKSEEEDKYGFLVKNGDLDDGRNYFVCSSHGVQQTITVDVERTEQRSCPPSLANYETFDEFKYVNEVTISSKTDNFAIGGEDLELNCTFYGIVDDAYNFTWQLPNDIIKKEGRLHIEFDSGVSKLIVHNLDKTKDAGTYKCIAEAQNRSYTDILNVNNILGENEAFINLITPFFSERGEDAISAYIFAKYSGYPTPTIIWRDTDGNDISISKDPYYVSIYPDERLVMLSIRRPKLGNYTLYAFNNRTQTEKQILLINQIKKPELTITLYKSQNSILVKCDVQGNPKSKIYLEACGDYGHGGNHCYRTHDTDLVTATTSDNKQTSFREFDHSNSGRVVNVSCFADNGFEKTLKTTFIEKGTNVNWIAVSLGVITALLISGFCVYRYACGKKASYSTAEVENLQQRRQSQSNCKDEIE